MVAGLPLAQIADRYGTPCLILSERLLLTQLEAFRAVGRRHLPPHAVFYSMKTNDVPVLLKSVLRAVDGLELVSRSELERALALGVGGAQLILNGPNKSAEELVAAFRAGVSLINLDGLADLVRAERIAAELGVKARAGIRLAFREDKVWEKFGVSGDGEELLAMLALLEKSEHLELVALHHHGDPYLGEPGDLRPLLERIFEVRERLEKRGFELPILDLGGGWEPVVELDEHGEWKQDPRTESAFRQLGEFLERRPVPQLILEPGRALVEAAIVAVSTIGSIKRDRGATFVFVDLSTYFVGGRHPCDQRVKYLLDAPHSDEGELCMIAGPMCSGSDVLGEARLGGVREGRRLIMSNAGAYTLTLRWHGPLPAPKLIWIDAAQQVEVLEYP